MSNEEEKKADEQEVDSNEALENKKHVVLNEVDDDQFDEQANIEIKKVDMGYLFKSDIKKWEDIPIQEDYIKNLLSAGFIKPSKIQGKAVQRMISEKMNKIVYLIQSQNGSGKTLCFLLGVLARIDAKLPTFDKGNLTPQAIIIVQTKELQNQVDEVITQLNVKTTHNIKVAKVPCAKTESGHILIGTAEAIGKKLKNPPGVKNPIINFDLLNTFIVDEADSIFTQDKAYKFMQYIFQKIKSFSKNPHLYFISATFTPLVEQQIQEVSVENQAKFLKLTVKKTLLTLQGVNQIKLRANSFQQKCEIIFKIFTKMRGEQSIIFLNTKRECDELIDYLKKNGFISAAVLYGFPMKIPEREIVMTKFKKNELNILITTNLLARGIDLRMVTLVINADIPVEPGKLEPDYDTYLHRIGRTGRFGDVGIALNIVTDKHDQILKKIEEHFAHPVQELKNIEQLPDLIAKCKGITQEKNKQISDINYGTDF